MKKHRCFEFVVQKQTCQDCLKCLSCWSTSRMCTRCHFVIFDQRTLWQHHQTLFRQGQTPPPDTVCLEVHLLPKLWQIRQGWHWHQMMQILVGWDWVWFVWMRRCQTQDQQMLYLQHPVLLAVCLQQVQQQNFSQPESNVLNCQLWHCNLVLLHLLRQPTQQHFD